MISRSSTTYPVKAIRIGVAQWVIDNINIGIDATLKPDRITLEKARQIAVVSVAGKRL